MNSETNLVIPSETVNRIVERIEPRNPQAFSAFVNDAINSYFHLADLIREGGALLLRGQDGKVRNVVLPFQVRSDATPPAIFKE